MNSKSVIVTGASSGIGFASASKFAAEGFSVFAVGRNEDSLRKLQEECAQFEGRVVTHTADLSDSTQIRGLVEAAAKTFESIDVLINSAGIIASGSIENTTSEAWDLMMGINVKSVFELTQLCVPLLANSIGSVVNVSSVAGKRSFPNVLAYCVSKAAVDQLTRCVALELADKGIRVNAVNPGVVISNLHKRSGMDEEQYEAFLEHSKSTHPLGRVGTAAEVADLVYFLSSESASWITGGTFEIDGGRAQTCAR
jgi:NAD(P)-dependent dehydrogenase (short-subunit alcohol dehydrogenase family)